MAIYVPGKRNRQGRKIGSTKRNVVAVLQLTAMVDMFTVLVVFLLQNYASTNQILPIVEQIDLPLASSVRELKPSLVVALSTKDLSFNEKKILSFQEVKQLSDLSIAPLMEVVQKTIENIKKDKDLDEDRKQEDEVAPYYRVTLQVDKEVDFLSVKKVLYTLTEAGVQKVNFAVVKVKAKDKYSLL